MKQEEVPLSPFVTLRLSRPFLSCPRRVFYPLPAAKLTTAVATAPANIYRLARPKGGRIFRGPIIALDLYVARGCVTRRTAALAHKSIRGSLFRWKRGSGG